MYEHSLSTVERLWLRALRLVGGASGNLDDAIRRANRLLVASGARPAGRAIGELLDALDAAGAQRLYLETVERPGVTGDERDLLAALGACYMDDPLAAERALGALLPPGTTGRVLPLVEQVSRSAAPAPRCRSGAHAAEPWSMAGAR